MTHPPARDSSGPSGRRSDPREGSAGGDAPRGATAVPRAAGADAGEAGRPRHPTGGEVLLLGSTWRAAPGRTRTPGLGEPIGHRGATGHGRGEGAPARIAAGPPSIRPRTDAARHVEPR